MRRRRLNREKPYGGFRLHGDRKWPRRGWSAGNEGSGGQFGCRRFGRLCIGNLRVESRDEPRDTAGPPGAAPLGDRPWERSVRVRARRKR